MTKRFFKNFDREIYRYVNEDIQVVEIANALSWSNGTYHNLIEMITRSPIVRWRFDYGLPKWIRTAYEKPMKVNV
jgi:hypothetical protein